MVENKSDHCPRCFGIKLVRLVEEFADGAKMSKICEPNEWRDLHEELVPVECWCFKCGTLYHHESI